MTEGLRRSLVNCLAEARPHENVFAQLQRVTFPVDRFEIQRRIGARHRQAHRVGTGIDGRDMNRLGHSGVYRQRWASAAEGVYFVARIPNCSPIRWRNCLFTVGTLASPSSSRKLCFFAMTSNSRLIIV